MTDPVVIIREGTDEVYIKSFIGENNVIAFISVEKDKEDGRWVVSNYPRHKREVENKIKQADSIVYIKDDRGSPANDETPSPEGGVNSP